MPDGVDNASATIVATPTPPAELDLYIPHRGSDGRWSADLAAGTSGELTRRRTLREEAVPQLVGARLQYAPNRSSGGRWSRRLRNLGGKVNLQCLLDRSSERWSV